MLLISLYLTFLLLKVLLRSLKLEIEAADDVVLLFELRLLADVRLSQRVVLSLVPHQLSFVMADSILLFGELLVSFRNLPVLVIDHQEGLLVSCLWWLLFAPGEGRAAG